MTAQTFNYQQKKQQLEDIVSWFQTGDIDFEQASVKYAEANKLITELNSFLNDSKSKLEIVEK